MGTVAAPSLLSKIIALIVVGLASGSHRPDLRSVGPGANVTATTARPPAGEWDATGYLFATDGPGTGAHRTLTGRRWRFVNTCRTSACHTVFLRTTPAGIQRTVLHAHGRYFTATFGPVPQPCEGVPGRPGNYTAHFRLRWSIDGETLFAREYGHYGGRCTPGWTSAHWSATRVYGRSSEGSQEVL